MGIWEKWTSRESGGRKRSDACEEGRVDLELVRRRVMIEYVLCPDEVVDQMYTETARLVVARQVELGQEFAPSMPDYECCLWSCAVEWGEALGEENRVLEAMDLLILGFYVAEVAGGYLGDGGRVGGVVG